VLRRALRLGIRLGLLAGVAYAVVKVLDAKRAPEPEPEPGPALLPVRVWPRLEPDPGLEGPRTSTAPQPDPEAPAPVAAAPVPAVAWVEPTGEVCPTTHPVKAKLSSKIFHLPGGLSYERTRPDRCYADAAAAEADGLRPAKR
jgi:hypothetical protein